MDLQSNFKTGPKDSFGHWFEVDDFYVEESKTTRKVKARITLSAEEANKFKEEVLDSYKPYVEYLHFSYVSRISASLDISGVYKIEDVSIDEYGEITLFFV